MQIQDTRDAGCSSTRNCYTVLGDNVLKKMTAFCNSLIISRSHRIECTTLFPNFFVRFYLLMSLNCNWANSQGGGRFLELGLRLWLELGSGSPPTPQHFDQHRANIYLRPWQRLSKVWSDGWWQNEFSWKFLVGVAYLRINAILFILFGEICKMPHPPGLHRL